MQFNATGWLLMLISYLDYESCSIAIREGSSFIVSQNVQWTSKTSQDQTLRKHAFHLTHVQGHRNMVVLPHHRTSAYNHPIKGLEQNTFASMAHQHLVQVVLQLLVISSASGFHPLQTQDTAKLNSSSTTSSSTTVGGISKCVRFFAIHCGQYTNNECRPH